MSYFDPVRDRYDDSYFPSSNGDHYLMEPPWEGERYLMELPPFGDPGDPLAERGRRRSRQPEERAAYARQEGRRMREDIFPTLYRLGDVPAPGMPLSEPEVRVQDRLDTYEWLDARMIDAMGDAGAPYRYPRNIRDVDLEFLEPPRPRRSYGGLDDAPLYPGEDQTAAFLKSRLGPPRRERSPSIALERMLPPREEFPDPRMPPRKISRRTCCWAPGHFLTGVVRPFQSMAGGIRGGSRRRTR
jgi:hypothetical protein